MQFPTRKANHSLAATGARFLQSWAPAVLSALGLPADPPGRPRQPPGPATLLLHQVQYRSLLAAAAGGAAAFADVAAAGRAHLGAAGQAQRGVRSATLLRLAQLGGAGGLGRLRRPGWRRRFLRPTVGPLHGRGPGHFAVLLLFGQRRRVLAGQLGDTL